jgi:hypothetical protein
MSEVLEFKGSLEDREQRALYYTLYSTFKLEIKL